MMRWYFAIAFILAISETGWAQQPQEGFRFELPHTNQTDGSDALVAQTIEVGQLQTAVPPASAGVAGLAERANREENAAVGSRVEDDVDALNQLRMDLDERIKALEGNWDNVAKKEMAKTMKPSFRLGGRIHLDHWQFHNETEGIGFFENPSPTSANFGNDPADRFAFRRIRLEFEGDMPNNMLWRLQTEFATPENPQIRDVYLGWKNLPGNQRLQIGNQKRPIGLDHMNSSRYNVFTERPLVIEAFNEDARRLGIQMTGVRVDESLNWRYGIFNLENIQDSGEYLGDSMQLGCWGRLTGTPWYDKTSGGRGYLHLGVAGGIARPDGDVAATDANTNESRFRVRPEARSTNRWLDTGQIAGADWYEQLGLEAILNIGALQITSEYQGTFLQRDNVTGGGLPNVNFHGGYIYANYFLTGEHMPINRSTGTLARVKPLENFFLIDRASGGIGRGLGAISVAYRMSYLDLTSNDITGGESWSHTGALNWHWTSYAKMQMNLSYGKIEDRGPIGGFSDGDYWLAGTRFAIDF
jgi:phosphate-selective porin OprO/OprP